MISLLATHPATAEENNCRPSGPGRLFHADTLNLLTLNVAHARGKALNQIFVSAAGHRQNLARIASLLTSSGADIVALQEADAPSLWSGGFDHVQHIAENTQYTSVVHGQHADSWLFTYGAALLSRCTLRETRSHSFRPSWPTAGKGFVVGSLLWQRNVLNSAARPVTVVSVHLDFSRESVRRSQVAELVDELRGIETPLVVMGDFNGDLAEADSPLHDLVEKLGLRSYRLGSNDLGTYRQQQRLDWILISTELRFIDYNVIPDIVSDHRAVAARIEWRTQDP